MTIKEQIEHALKLPVSPSNVDLCDYQCNVAFQMAKEQKKNPLEIAKEIAAQFKSDVATATACPPGFVNFKVTDTALGKTAQEILKTGKLPLCAQKSRTVFFDYGGANVAKELHIGHLRSPIIGEALKRVFKAFGHKTISDTFFGDWGLQMGLVLAQLIYENYIVDDNFVKPVTLDTFNEVYPAASKRSKTEHEFRAYAEEITLELQNKTQPYFSLWQHIRKISVDKISESYKTLNCTFDTLKGESDAQPYINEVLAILKKHGAYESNGCLVMDVKTDSDKKPMPPVILQKGNGGDLYATTDIATIYYRYKNFKPDEFIYCTDFRQELHIEQLFRVAVKANLVPPQTKLTHVSYGTMNGTDGKPFKTRSGETVKLDDVIGIVTEAAAKRVKNPSQVGDLTAQKIGLAALKFADLSNNVRKDYVFDIDKFTSFEGKTGPYLLYTIARINSIFNKADSGSAANVLLNRDILMKVIKLADSYTVSAQNYTLNGIVDAAYELAAEFNLFYANVKIADNPSALALCKVVKTALLFALDTLAIQPVDEM